jgi:hypothetical protein
VKTGRAGVLSGPASPIQHPPGQLALCRAGVVAVTEYRAAWDNLVISSIIRDVFVHL